MFVFTLSSALWLTRKLAGPLQPPAVRALVLVIVLSLELVVVMYVFLHFVQKDKYYKIYIYIDIPNLSSELLGLQQVPRGNSPQWSTYTGQSLFKRISPLSSHDWLFGFSALSTGQPAFRTPVLSPLVSPQGPRRWKIVGVHPLVNNTVFSLCSTTISPLFSKKLGCYLARNGIIY
jgi:hypothetical protein